ncbi:MAG: MGMT family protein [Deltaproteobacteria bacterium]|nr:MGMT family protein [Deltaproteobacteria bacterium]
MRKQTLNEGEWVSQIEQGKGTLFQKKVWKVLLKIPQGKTRSYRWVAQKIGRSKAVRAVANACGKNPYAPFVPCHRVVRSDGSLGGYSSGGVSVKKKLLRKEGVLF